MHVSTVLTYLHECAHFFLHRNDETTPCYLKEFQAETWALDKMQAAGITVPEELVFDSKRRIANESEELYVRKFSAWIGRLLNSLGLTSRILSLRSFQALYAVNELPEQRKDGS